MARKLRVCGRLHPTMALAAPATPAPTPVTSTAGPSNKPNRHPVRIRFANVSATEASCQKVALSAKREASLVYTSKLILTDEQRRAVEALYNSSQTVSLVYQRTEADQLAAAATLAMAALDENSQEALGSRWSVRYTRTMGKGAEATTRVLYQWCVNRTCFFGSKLTV